GLAVGGVGSGVRGVAGVFPGIARVVPARVLLGGGLPGRIVGFGGSAGIGILTGPGIAVLAGIFAEEGGGSDLRALLTRGVAPALDLARGGLGLIRADHVALPVSAGLGVPVGPEVAVELFRARIGLVVDRADHSGLGILGGEPGASSASRPLSGAPSAHATSISPPRSV